MEVKLYFRMLQRNWWLILLTAMVALTVSLTISYLATPQFSAVARFIIVPSSSLTSGADVVRSLDTLDRRSVVATYAEVMNSSRILENASNFLKLDAATILREYSIQSVDLPDSSVLELTVSGPNPQLAAQLANAIGFQSITFTRSLNLIYELNFLDTAVPPEFGSRLKHTASVCVWITRLAFIMRITFRVCWSRKSIITPMIFCPLAL